MICKIDETIEKYNMLASVKSVAVGVSGGADSVCLLHYLSSVRERYDILLKAVHVNHQIRGEEADRDRRFVEQLCERLGVELRVFSIDVPALARQRSVGVEECGRQVRYECFDSLGCDAVAVAHTLSDSVETALFNFARGTGLKGICGIPPKRGNIIRPLIECTRQEIEQYCSDNGLSFVTDSTNCEDEYARNNIRHYAVPALKKINPDFEKCALRFFESAYDENAFIEKCAKRLIDETSCNAGYMLKPWQECDEAVLRRACAILCRSALSKPVESRHIELCCKMIKGGSGKIELSKDLYIQINSDIISIQSKKQPAEQWTARISGTAAKTPYGVFSVCLCDASDISDRTDCIDADTVFGEPYFRSRLPGDRFTDPKRKNTKTLKKLFNEKKIPPQDRNKIAVLCVDDTVLWVEGFSVNAAHRVTDKTKRVYIVKKEGEANE